MANTVIAGLGFHHIALKAQDIEKSARFYEALGLTEIVAWGEGSDEIRMHDLGDGGRLELFANGGDAYAVAGKWAHFAFSCDDVDAAYKTALGAGGVPHIAPKTVPLNARPDKISIRIAFVLGPDGEQIEFFHEC